MVSVLLYIPLGMVVIHALLLVAMLALNIFIVASRGRHGEDEQ